MGVFDYRGWNCHMIRRLGGFTIDLVSIAEVSKLCGMYTLTPLQQRLRDAIETRHKLYSKS